MTDLNHLRGWQSNKVAQRYIEDSLHNKNRSSKLVANTINLEPSTSKDNQVFPLLKQKKHNNNDHSKIDKERLSPQLKRLKLDHLETSSSAHDRSTKAINIDNYTVTIHNY